MSRELRTVVVRVKGIAFEEFARLRRMAESIRGVATVRARPFSEGLGELEVECSGDPLDLAKSFTALSGLRLRVARAGAQVIELEAVAP